MRKKFTAKKQKKGKFKIILVLIIIYLIYELSLYFITKFQLATSNEEFIINVIKNNSYPSLYKQNQENIFNKLFTFITSINLKEPVTILEKGFSYKKENNKITHDEDSNLEQLTYYVENPLQNNSNNPLVYIYNSHQLENYSMDYLEGYNITPNVLMASYLLKEKLDKLNIPTIAEESNIIEFMKINNWNYNDSYKASRYYVTDAINKNPSLELIIDLHRDALSKKDSTVEIEGRKYAKILFVVGKEHDSYLQNLELANNLNNIITKKYPNLTRGVITKEGENVNGIYNQDLSPKMILLEVGGNYNSIDEVLNTIDILSLIIKEYLNGK